MKLFQTIDGTLIGFYQERGGEVQAIMYRDVYENRKVTKEREAEVWVESTYKTTPYLIPGKWDMVTQEFPGRFERRRVWIEAYEEEKLVEIPGYYERRHVQEPGHYEIKPVWFEEREVTRYTWREAHPARGLEAAWIPYQELIPAGYSDTRVWVEGEWRTIIFRVDTTYEWKEVTVPAHWGSETIWIEPKTVSRKVWIPPKYINIETGEHGHWETQMVETTLTEEVWVGYEPVYSYLDPAQNTLFEVISLEENAAPGPEFDDKIVIQNKLTGEYLTTTAKYLGMATKIDENEYIVPW